MWPLKPNGWLGGPGPCLGGCGQKSGSLGNGPMAPGPHSRAGPGGAGFVLASEQDQADCWGSSPSVSVPSHPLSFQPMCRDPAQYILSLVGGPGRPAFPVQGSALMLTIFASSQLQLPCIPSPTLSTCPTQSNLFSPINPERVSCKYLQEPHPESFTRTFHSNRRPRRKRMQTVWEQDLAIRNTVTGLLESWHNSGCV